MDVTAKQKLLLDELKKKIKQLKSKEKESRTTMRAALKKLNKIGHDYKIQLAGKMREMEHKIAHSEAACYVKIAADLESQLVKGIKHKLKALKAAAKRVKPAKPTKTTTKKRVKRASAKRAKPRS